MSVTRSLLNSDQPLSLRSVAHEMGLTAPALYRYVDSYEALLLLAADAIYDDVLDELTKARDEYRDDDPAAQILMSAIGFRQWALSHPPEFGLLFANPVTGKAARPDDSDVPGVRFGAFFAEIYQRLWVRYQFTVPTEEDLGPDVVDLLRSPSTAEGPAPIGCASPMDQIDGPVGLRWVFMRSWARLYGIVTLEVFAHIDPRIVDTGTLFVAVMRDNAEDLGITAELERLQSVVGQRLHG